MEDTTILIVDDEELIRRTLQFDLKKTGYNVTIASSGEDAIQKLKETEFDIIITDLMMDKVSGLDVLQAVRAKKTESMVIIFTGYASIDTAIEAVRLGANDYILKPYNKDEMILKIGNCKSKLELLRKVKLYENILPVCCKCKKIRDDTGCLHGEGEWMAMEVYLQKKAKVDVSHGYCHACYDEVKKEIEDYKDMLHKDDNC
ncbi:MAG: response regulator [Candidatus Anammoxibacter sp.]